MPRPVCVGTSVAPPSSRAGGRILAIIAISVLWKVRLGWGRGTGQRASRRFRHRRPPRASGPSSTPALPRTHCHGTRQEARKRFYKSEWLSTRADSGWRSCVWGVGVSGRNGGGGARCHLLRSGPVQPRTATRDPPAVFRLFLQVASHIFAESSFKLNYTRPRGQSDQKRLPCPGRPMRTLVGPQRPPERAVTCLLCPYVAVLRAGGSLLATRVREEGAAVLPVYRRGDQGTKTEEFAQVAPLGSGRTEISNPADPGPRPLTVTCSFSYCWM